MSITIAKDQKKHYGEGTMERDMTISTGAASQDKIWRRRVVRVDATLMSQLTDNNGT